MGPFVPLPPLCRSLAVPSLPPENARRPWNQCTRLPESPHAGSGIRVPVMTGALPPGPPGACRPARSARQAARVPAKNREKSGASTTEDMRPGPACADGRIITTYDDWPCFSPPFPPSFPCSPIPIPPLAAGVRTCSCGLPHARHRKTAAGRGAMRHAPCCWKSVTRARCWCSAPSIRKERRYAMSTCCIRPVAWWGETSCSSTCVSNPPHTPSSPCPVPRSSTAARARRPRSGSISRWMMAPGWSGFRRTPSSFPAHAHAPKPASTCMAAPG